MKSDMSVYQCQVCKAEREAEPSRKIGCSRCNSLMKEIVSGIIQKGAPIADPVKQEEPQGMLKSQNSAIKKAPGRKKK